MTGPGPDVHFRKRRTPIVLRAAMRTAIESVTLASKKPTLSVLHAGLRTVIASITPANKRLTLCVLRGGPTTANG
jgi:hypothetical protein